MTGIKMTATPTPQHTPGPWRWEVRPKDKVVELVGGGKHRYDLTVLKPTRWGMNGATVLLQETDESAPSITYKLMSERPEWCQPLPGRKHHAHWIQTVNHPDLLLIQAAPDMLQALRRSSLVLAAVCERHTEIGADEVYKEVSRAIEEAVFGKKES